PMPTTRYTLSLHDALPISMASFTMTTQLELGDSGVLLVDLQPGDICTEFNQAVSKSTQGDPYYDAKVAKTWNVSDRNIKKAPKPDRKSTRLNSSHVSISYA